MSAKDIERMDMSEEVVLGLLERAKAVLREDDYRHIENLVKTLAHITRLLEQKKATIRQLRKLLFGFKTEKLERLFENSKEAKSQASEGVTPDDRPDSEAEAAKEKKKRKGHGRNSAASYTGAERIQVPLDSLKPGDPCPEPGCKGKVYALEPAVIVRIVGEAPLGAKVGELERLRCNLCLKVFTAKVPEELEGEKYDATAGSMIGILRYGTGVPFNRLKRLQESLGIPLPASTQWDIVEGVAKRIAPVHAALIDEAAQGDVLHNDDTPMKILDLMEKRKERRADDG
jgi:transposase